MTIQEFSELEPYLQQSYLEDTPEEIENVIADLKDTIDLPYPENIIKYAYGKRSYILRPTESFWDKFIEDNISRLSPESAVEMRCTLDIIFKRRGSIEELSQAVDVIPYSAAKLPYWLARVLRKWRNRRYLCDYIEIIPDEEDTIYD